MRSVEDWRLQCILAENWRLEKAHEKMMDLKGVVLYHWTVHLSLAKSVAALRGRVCTSSLRARFFVWRYHTELLPRLREISNRVCQQWLHSTLHAWRSVSLMSLASKDMPSVLKGEDREDKTTRRGRDCVSTIVVDGRFWQNGSRLISHSKMATSPSLQSLPSLA